MGSTESKSNKSKPSECKEIKDHIKVVFVGDLGCGKTSLGLTYTTKEFPEVYTPTIFDNCETELEYNGHTITLGLWDAVRDPNSRLRALCYPETDVFLLIFSVDSPPSYDNILTAWFPEVEHHAPDAKRIVVGTKIDLRNDEDTLARLQENGLAVITEEEGESLAEKVKAIGYLECSALTREGVDNIFDQIVRYGVLDDYQIENVCSISKAKSARK